MYFKTRTLNVKEVVFQMMETFNEEHGTDIPLTLKETLKGSSGSFQINRTQNVIKGIVLDPDTYEDFEHNRVYIYILLHEIGHAYDAINFHYDVTAYGNKYRKNMFQYEMTAWELGIKWALKHGFINKMNFRNLRKFMNQCLTSYSKGKYNVTESIETIFSQIEGGN